MKQLLYASLAVSLVAFTTPGVHAQRNKDDVKITIKVDGKKQDLETYFEEWGEKLGESVEEAFENDTRLTIDIDDQDLDLVIDDFSIAIGEIVESVAEAVAVAVNHMDIEIRDIDRKDFNDADVSLHGTEMEDLIDEIEDRYDSKVKKIEKLKIKLRDDDIRVDMDVRLENGRRINKVKVIPKEQ